MVVALRQSQPREWLKGPPGTRTYAAVWFPDRSAESVWDVLILVAAVQSAGGSPTRASLAVALGTMMLVVSAPIGGALADRFTLLRTASWTLLARALIFLLLLFAISHGTQWWVIAALVAGMALVDGAHFPAVSGLGRLLTRDHDERGMTQVTSARDAVGTLAKIGGTAAAGLLIGWRSTAAAALAVALVLVASMMLRRLRKLLDSQETASVDEAAASSADDSGLWSSFGVVWRLVRHHREHAIRLTMFAASNACTIGPLLLAIPLMSRDYSWPWWGIALAFVLNAAGALSGAVALNRYGRKIHSRLRFGLLILLPAVAGMTLVAVGHVPVLVGIGLLIAAPAFAVNSMLMESDLRVATPRSAQGAMGALQDICIFGVGPLGQILFGVLASATSLRTAGLVFAAAMLAITILALSLIRPVRGRRGPSARQHAA